MLTFVFCLSGAPLVRTGLPCAQDGSALNVGASFVISRTQPAFAICARQHNAVDAVVRRVGRWPDCDVLPTLMPKEPAPPWERYLFVDVGANIGACTLLMASLGHRIVAFEPVASTYHALAAGMSANDFGHGFQMRLVNAAASTTKGQATISTSVGNAGHSYFAGAGAHMPRDPTEFGGRAAVFGTKYTTSNISVTTLDEVVKEHVHLMKLDTQVRHQRLGPVRRRSQRRRASPVVRRGTS